jgi:seryl-tRNA synthetase
MLDIKFIRENKDLIGQNNKKRGVNVDASVLLDLDEKRRKQITQIEELRAQRKQGSKGGKPSEEEISKMRELGTKISELESELAVIENEWREMLMKVPNLTHPDVPVGGEDDFKVIYSNWEPKKFEFNPKDHEQLMLELDLIDFERGAKVATSKFYFMKNDLVRLNQAMINYGIDVATKHGYTLLETPDLAKNEILQGIGFNPRGEETQVYYGRNYSRRVSRQ